MTLARFLKQYKETKAPVAKIITPEAAIPMIRPKLCDLESVLELVD